MLSRIGIDIIFGKFISNILNIKMNILQIEMTIVYQNMNSAKLYLFQSPRIVHTVE